MKKGTRVSWLAKETGGGGSGVTVSDEEDGHILVACDPNMFFGIPPAYQIIVRCPVSWFEGTLKSFKTIVENLPFNPLPLAE